MTSPKPAKWWIDSLKGSLTSLEAGNAIGQGIHSVMPDAEVRVCPLADEGEGTMDRPELLIGGNRYVVRKARCYSY